MKREILFRAWDKQRKFMVNDGAPLDFWIQVGGHNEDIVWMQYTGLKDKNGVKIFEGDIITTYSKLLDQNIGKDIVKYERCGFYLPNEEYKEIIGNIYQNPDLLTS